MVNNKHISTLKKIGTIAQSSMIFILIVIVVIMMLRINRLQGTARVINYAGLVRGATQRVVKLEMADQPNNDLNNLKRVNDIFGHMVGDQFILNFSNLLRNAIPAQDFVGRYGGDEFMAVIIYNASNEKIHRINVKLDEEVKRFNKLNHSGDHLDINYAHGCAFSTDYSQCTVMILFNRADKNMYKDKIRSKNMENKNVQQKC